MLCIAKYPQKLPNNGIYPTKPDAKRDGMRCHPQKSRKKLYIATDCINETIIKLIDTIDSKALELMFRIFLWYMVVVRL